MTIDVQHEVTVLRPRGSGERPALPAPEERRRLRRKWRLSERQVAEAFGVTVTTVRSWESGRTSPRGGRRTAYAAFLGGLAQTADVVPGTGTVVRTRKGAVGPRRPAPSPAERRAPELPDAGPCRRTPVVTGHARRGRPSVVVGVSVGAGTDPVSPARRRRLRLMALAVGVWTGALHLVLTCPPPHL
ncbi:helix-turn-helix domain-containing protein [Streptomyces sp. NPDC055055]